MTTAIFIILGIAGVSATVYYGRKATERAAEARLAHVDSVRRWRKRQFAQAMGYLAEYAAASERLPTVPAHRDLVDQKVLQTWAANLLLTAGSLISPYSQGKANLFIANARDNEKEEITLRSRYFAGAFPLRQLMDLTDDSFRDMVVSTASSASLDRVAVAGKTILANSIQFEAISDQAFRSDPEKKLGATHILGIPICESVREVQPGNPVAITVDLRLPWWTGIACKLGVPLEERIRRRAEQVQRSAREILKGTVLL